MRVLRSRLFIAAVASTLTAFVVGGVAWAVQSPVDGSGAVHACYNPKNGAVNLNVNGACPAKGRSAPISWNVQGPPGEPAPSRSIATASSPWKPGGPGQPLESGALLARTDEACLTAVGYPCTSLVGNDWKLVPGSLSTLDTPRPGVLEMRFSASTACFGSSNDKYVRLVVDNEPVPDPAPLAVLPVQTVHQSEVAVSFERTLSVTTAGEHTVQVEVRLGADAVCGMGWHLIAEVIN